MREKEIDGRHAEADSLGLGNQPGTTPFVTASAFTVSYLQVTSGLLVILPRSHRASHSAKFWVRLSLRD
jgi:hypothetical protein